MLIYFSFNNGHVVLFDWTRNKTKIKYKYQFSIIYWKE